MKQLVKRVFIQLTNSIRKKLIFYTMLIILLLVSVNMYTLISGNTLNSLYSSIIQKQLLCNTIFINLENTDAFLTNYLVSGTQSSFEKYKESRDTLKISTNEFSNMENKTSYNRTAIDFNNMVCSYIEQTDTAVSFAKTDRNDAFQHYENEKSIYKLIDQSFNAIYSLLLRDTAEYKNRILDKWNNLYTISEILLILVGIISVVFLQCFSSSLTKPVKKLTQAAVHASQGDMSVVRGISTNDEISILAQAFNKMIVTINQQILMIKGNAEIEKKLDAEKMENLSILNLLKESEMKALQSRINPHFLFNTLNMIAQTSYIEKASQTTSLLETTSELLRYNLDNFSKVVTLADELENIQDYMLIQRMRFGSRITFEAQADEEVKSSKIPCLILQPLVENSVIHGVGFYVRDGVVGVEIRKCGERVRLRVYDNGEGIEKTKLESLLQDLSSNSVCDIPDASSSIGLQNVYSRLRIFFYDDVKIYIHSEPRVLTEIVLDLPFQV